MVLKNSKHYLHASGWYTFIHNSETIFSYQSPLTLTFVLLPKKSIGINIDSWEIYLASFSTKGEIQAVICPETIINHQSPITLTFDLKINRGHPWFIGKISVKFHDYKWNTGSNQSRDHFKSSKSYNFDLWP